jgi:DNA-binding LacI/PurR family transcriptional regulator
VAFGRADDAWKFAWVDVDGVNGMEQVVQHLTANRHSRIGLITWPAGSKAGSHREAGYSNGLAAVGLERDPEWVVRGENTVQTGAEGMRKLMALPVDRRPTAVACVSDTIAIGAMGAAAVEGFVVGRDLAVTGYDDSSMAQFLHPPLTSIRQPIGEVGSEIVRLLLDQLARRAGHGRGTLLKPRLVIRDSSDFKRSTNNE